MPGTGGGGAGVEAALFFLASTPASRPRVLARSHGARAGPAADAGIAALMKGVVGHVVGAQVLPDLLGRPARKGVHLDQFEALVGLHHAGPGPVPGLIAPDRRDPGVEAGQGAA